MAATEGSETGSPASDGAGVVVGTGGLLLGMLVLSACAGLLYAGTLASMVGVWEASSTFAHGFLVLPASAFVIWRQRGALRPGSVRPSFAGFSLLGVAVVLWLLSSAAHAQVGQHLAFVAILTAGIWAVLGSENARAIRFPLLFAFFAVPFGEFLIPPLMVWTAEFAVWALKATGIPVYLEAYTFSLPSGDFRVIEACSGIRYLIVTVVIAVFFAHDRFISLKRRTFFVLGAAAAIILANGIRAYLLVLIVHSSGREFGTGPGHIYLGWFIFLVSILIILAIGGRFSDRSNREGGAHPAGVDPGESTAERFPRSAYLSMLTAIAIMALGPLGQRVAYATSSDDLLLAMLPNGVDAWSGPGPARLEYRPRFSGDYQAAHGSYATGVGTVDVHEILFTEQNQGNELINDSNVLFDHSQWRLIQRIKTRTVPLEGRSIEVKSLVIGNGRRNILLWYWYDIGGWRTTSDTAAKVFHVLQAISGRSAGDALLILATPTSSDGRDSARLRAFMEKHFDALNVCLRASSQTGRNCRLQELRDTNGD